MFCSSNEECRVPQYSDSKETYPLKLKRSYPVCSTVINERKSMLSLLLPHQPGTCSPCVRSFLLFFGWSGSVWWVCECSKLHLERKNSVLLLNPLIPLRKETLSVARAFVGLRTSAICVEDIPRLRGNDRLVLTDCLRNKNSKMEKENETISMRKHVVSSLSHFFVFWIQTRKISLNNGRLWRDIKAEGAYPLYVRVWGLWYNIPVQSRLRYPWHVR